MDENKEMKKRNTSTLNISFLAVNFFKCYKRECTHFRFRSRSDSIRLRVKTIRLRSSVLDCELAEWLRLREMQLQVPVLDCDGLFKEY